MNREQARIQELKLYKILDTEAEAHYDVLTQLASNICETPISLISLIDDKRQWFKSRFGLETKETPREDAFCAHAILGTEPFIISDTQLDARFQNNPLVTSEPHIRFYAGAPLITPNGLGLGTICVIDRTPRKLSGEQVSSLKILASMVMSQFELHRAHWNLRKSIKRVKEKENAIFIASTQLYAKAVERQKTLRFESARVATMGEFASGIANEINNPLAIIHGKAEILTELAQRDQVTPEVVRKYSNKISDVTMRISHIIRGLKNFARNAENEPFQIQELNSVVAETLNFCRDLLKDKGISLELKLIPEETWVRCRSIQISQILLSLINNAKDAIREQTQKWIRVDIKSEAEFINIYVTNSGKMIATELHEKIFQPFFTTKTVNYDTGIGLNISKEIAEAHQGHLTLNKKSKTTSFILSLPKASNPKVLPT